MKLKASSHWESTPDLLAWAASGLTTYHQTTTLLTTIFYTPSNMQIFTADARCSKQQYSHQNDNNGNRTLCSWKCSLMHIVIKDNLLCIINLFCKEMCWHRQLKSSFCIYSVKLWGNWKVWVIVTDNCGEGTCQMHTIAVKFSAV